MFGYVVANKSELKFKEFDIYRGYYCGLCHSLKSRHGIAGQMTLTYDMTFLAILLSSLYEPDTTKKLQRCVVHPIKKHLSITNTYTDYVADMNVLLSYFKAMDDWHDDKSLLKLAFAKIIKSNSIYPDKASSIKELLERLSQYESHNETNIDLVSGVFGEIMSILFVPHEDVWAPHLKRMGFFLGKFIYILDAYDDLEKDIKRNNYNPFKDICKDDNFDDRIKSMLTLMMAECSKAFEMLPIIENAEILRNILYSGVWSRISQKEAIQQNANKKKQA